MHREKKFSHFDLKSWVIGGIKIQLNFLGQNGSIFSLRAPREKMSHFDPKTWVTGRTKIWPNFLGQNDNYFLSTPIEKIESFWPKKLSLAELTFDPTF